MMKKLLFTALSLILFLSGVGHANAAVLSLLPTYQGDIHIGNEFIVDLIVNTEEFYVNAVQAKVTFLNSVLELVSVEKGNPPFNFWLKEPEISNETGVVEFIGGASKGVAGSSLHVIRMKFRVTGTGTSEISISDALVSASDGKGTNVLSGIENMSVSNYPETSTQNGSNGFKIEEPVVVPQKVIREPVISGSKPEAPELKVSLYPNQSKWYNHIGEVVALWELPHDITKIATDIDNNPNTDPKIITSNLTNGKNFGVLHKGIQYLHVQFKNNIGWGETTHYKISIDTTAPLHFEVEMDNILSDDPTPWIGYHSHDSLSGMSHAQIFIDDIRVFVDEDGLVNHTSPEFPDSDKLSHFESGTVVGPLPPGPHVAIVRLFDKAGNGVEDEITFDILPIEGPVIESVPEILNFEGADNLVWGHALPNIDVMLRVLDKDGEVIYTEKDESSKDGHWMISIDSEIPSGKYMVDAVSIDKRGAQSYPSEAVVIKVKMGGLSIGFIKLSPINIILLTLFVGVFSLELLPCAKKERMLQRIFRFNRGKSSKK